MAQECNSPSSSALPDLVLLHHRILGTATSFRGAPLNVLARVLDVTCFAVQAILCVDL